MSLVLTPRLAAVAQWIPQGARLADVGTDHGYLPVWLLLQGRIPSAVATDLRPGPLERAAQTVREYGVAGRVELRLCDGLSGVSAGEADAIAIAGMGGETILHILSATPWAADRRCVVQPMTSAEDLRSGLRPLGLRISRERLVQEGKTLYLVMELLPGDGGELTPAECLVGTAESHRGDPLWDVYLERTRRRVEHALDGLAHSERPSDEPRRVRLAQALDGLDMLLQENRR